MRRNHWLSLAALVVLAGCDLPDAGLRAHISIPKKNNVAVRADCVKLAIFAAGLEKGSAVVARPADDNLTIGVLRGQGWGNLVELEVSGLIGDCSNPDSLKLNTRADRVTFTFKDREVQDVDLVLEAPSRTLDTDGDGYAGGANGPDCNDMNAMVFPGGIQLCSEPTDNDCDGAPGCDDTQCSGVPFCADQPNKVTVTTPANTMLRGDCLGPLTLRLENDFGPRVAVRDTPLHFTNSIAGVTVHATANCGDMALDTLTIPFGGTTLEVYLSADEAAIGLDTFTARADRVTTPGSVMVEVHPRPYTALKFTSMPQTLRAGTCSPSPVAVELRDSMGRHTDVDADTTVRFSAAPGERDGMGIFYSDPGCTTAATDVTLTRGQGVASLYVLAKTANDVTLTASLSSLNDTQLLVVQASDAAALKFSNGQLILTTGVLCSTGTLQIDLKDIYGNDAKLPTDLTLSLTNAGGSNITYYAKGDATCSVALSSFVLPANTSRLELHVNATVASSTANRITVAAVSPPMPLTSDSQDLTVGAGPPTRFTLNGMPQTVVANQCSAMPVRLTVTDTQNNPSASSNQLTFTVTPGAGTPTGMNDPNFKFYLSAGCSNPVTGSVILPPNTASIDLWFSGQKVRTNFDVRVTTGSGLVGPTMPSTGHSIVAGAPTQLAFGSPLTQTATAGSCTPNPFTLNVSDDWGNPATFSGDRTIDISSNPAGVTVGAAPACGSGTTLTLTGGTSAASFNAQHLRVAAGGPYRLTASISATGIITLPTATASLTVTPATALLVSTPMSSFSGTAGTCQGVQLTRQDMYGNPAPITGTPNLGVTFSTTGAFDLHGTTDCGMAAVTNIGLAPGQTSINLGLKPRVATTATPHTITFNAQSAVATLTANIAPGAPSLVFVAPANGNATIAAGGCTTVTLARRDAFNNDVPLPMAAPLTFTPSSTSVGVYTDSNCTVSATSVTVPAGPMLSTFYVKGTMSAVGGGSATYGVDLTLLGQTTTLNLTVSPGAANLSFGAPMNGMATVLANDCVTVTLLRKDTQMNPVPIPAGVTTATLGPTTLEVYDSANCSGTRLGSPTVNTTIPVTPGQSQKTFTVRTTVASSPTLNITLDGQSVPLTLTVNPAAFARLVVQNVPASLKAGTCSTPSVTVRRTDNFNNDITADPPLTVTLTSTQFSFSPTASTCATPGSNAVVSISTGSAVSADPVFLTGQLATATNGAVVTATAPGGSGMVTGTATSTITPGDPASLVITSAAGSTTAGQCVTPVTFELRDAFTNVVKPSPGIAVTLTSDKNANFYPRAACGNPTGNSVTLTAASPTGTASFSPIASGTHTITFSATGVPSVTQQWNVAPGAASKLNWRAAPTAMLNRFRCTSAGVIEALDGNNNPANVTGPVTVTLASSTPTLQFFSDPACTAPATTTLIPAGSDVAPELYMYATGGNATVSASSSPVFTPPPSQNITITATYVGAFMLTTAQGTVLEAGSCVSLDVKRLTDTAADLATGTSVVTLSTPAGMEVHTNSSCTSALTLPLTYLPGTATQTVYVKGKSVAPTGSLPTSLSVTVASTGSTTGTQAFSVYPLVRRGSCNIADTQNTTPLCALSPPLPSPVAGLTRSFLLFSSAGRPATNGGNQLDPANQAVECHLDSTGGGNVECSRQGTSGAMSINYQVVTFGRDAMSGGISVQHLVANTSGMTTTTTVPLTTSVNPATSFILVSMNSGGASGGLNDADGFPLVRFTGTTTTGTPNPQASVDVVAPTSTVSRKVTLQVVTLGLPGALVEHKLLSGPTPSGNNYDVTTTTSMPNSFALAMASMSDTTTADVMCKRKLNAKLNSNTVVRLHRGGTGTPPTGCSADGLTSLLVQRITWTGLTSTTVSDVTFAPAVAAGSATQSTTAFTAVSLHRAMTLLGSQGQGGQAGGEASFIGLNPMESDDTGPFHALLDFNSGGTQVTVTRNSGATGVTSVFSPMVLSIDP